MLQLPYLLQVKTFTNNGPQTFTMRNAFDNIKIELYPGGNFMDAIIRINEKSNFFPINNLVNERSFYMPARKNPSIDNRYTNLNLHGILTGSSTVGGHMAYDGHNRLTYYHDLVMSIKKLHQQNQISDATYSMLRYQAQKASKLQLSVIGQNISECPPFGKPIAAQKAKAEAVGKGAKLSENAFKVRSSTDIISKISRGVGTGIVVFSVAQSIHTIVRSSNKLETATKEAGGWAGSLAGGEIGMQTGAEVGGAIGLCFAGAGFAPGAAIGGFIGGIAGGIGGYIWGHKAAEHIVSHNNPDAHFGGFGGGSSGGGGASGSW